MNFDKKRRVPEIPNESLESKLDNDDDINIEKSISDDEQFYILGYPVKTDIGLCHFVRVEEYPEVFECLTGLTFDKNKFIADLHKQKKETTQKERKEALNEAIKATENMSFLEIVNDHPQLNVWYKTLFTKVFRDQEIWDKVTEENFSYLRQLIAKMNNITLPTTNPNPEIQAALERSEKAKSGEGVNFTSIVTSLVVGSSVTYEEIEGMTLFQVNMTFKRISGFKDYETTTLFATVAEKVDVRNWAENIELTQGDKHAMTKEEFNQTTKEVFD